MSVLSKTISYFPSIRATTQGVPMNLLSILQSNMHKQRIINLRASNEEVQKQLKNDSPCYTVAAECNPRSEKGIIQLSGLAAVDLDSAEDYDVLYILKELQKIPSIAYAGLSCRGKRLFCIVPFLYPDQYRKHYERLIQSFADMGLPMGDTCHKIISQPRFISWNDQNTQFFNHHAKPYPLLTTNKTFFHIKRHSSSGVSTAIPENLFEWCNEQYSRSHEFSEYHRHRFILGLARYCNIKGLTKEKTVNGCLQYEQKGFNEKEICDMVTHIYTMQADSHNTIPFTVRKKKKVVQPAITPTKEIEVEHSPGATVEVADVKPEPVKPTSEKWNQQIADLEAFFETCSLPSQSIQLNGCSIIKDVSTFVQSHLAMVKAQNGNSVFEPYIQRLYQLKEYLVTSPKTK